MHSKCLNCKLWKKEAEEDQLKEQQIFNQHQVADFFFCIFLLSNLKLIFQTKLR